MYLSRFIFKCFILVLSILSVSCLVDSKLSEDRSQINCKAGDDCPENLYCLEQVRRCVVRSACISPDKRSAEMLENGLSCELNDGDKGVCNRGVCTNSKCGDGIVDIQSSEACDDGNLDNSDGCTNECRKASCGDGFIQSGETCDDGNSDNSDGCTDLCIENICGDGYWDKENEECDDGNSNNFDTCTNTCKLAICGDSYTQIGEECDDGNLNNFDACTNSCLFGFCGDGFIQSGEACDDGNSDNSDNCSNECRLNSCGDGIVQVGEECDDGNILDTDMCTNICLNAKCGDGFLQGNEKCDDGNTIDNDGCLNSCKIASCGDGIVRDNFEKCDDRNNLSGDGCTFDCQKVEVCGDGIIDDGEACDDGNSNLNDTCDDCKLTQWKNRLIVGSISEKRSSRHTQLHFADFIIEKDGTYVVLDPALQQIFRIKNEQIFLLAGATVGDETDIRGLGKEGIDAQLFRFNSIKSITKDAFGQILIADSSYDAIFALSPEQKLKQIAGKPFDRNIYTGDGYSGDGAEAKNAKISNPEDIIVDDFGNIYIADSSNHAIRKIDVNGIISTFAGGNGLGYSGDGGMAVNAQLYTPTRLAIGEDNSVYVYDKNRSIRKIEPSGVITTVVGGNGFGLNTDIGMSATDMKLTSCTDFVVENDKIIITDPYYKKITYIKDGVLFAVYSTSANGELSPTRLNLFDGSLYSSSTYPQRIKVSHLETQMTAESFEFDSILEYEFYGVDEVLEAKYFDRGVEDLIYTQNGTIIFADGRGVIYEMDSNNEIRRIAGTGESSFNGDGLDAKETNFTFIMGLQQNDNGELLFADEYNGRVRKINQQGQVETLVGGGTESIRNWPEPTKEPLLQDLSEISHLQQTASGEIFIALTGDGCVVKLNLNHQLEMVAGICGQRSLSPLEPENETNPLTTVMYRPQSMLWDEEKKELYIAERTQNVIRKIDSLGVMHRIAGNGDHGYPANNSDALNSGVDPYYITFDKDKQVVFSDRANLYYITDAGKIMHYAPTQWSNFHGEGGAIEHMHIGNPFFLVKNPTGGISFYDYRYNSFRVQDEHQQIRSIIGSHHNIIDDQFLSASLQNAQRMLFVDQNLSLVTGGKIVKQVDFTEESVETVAGFPKLQSDIFAKGFPDAPAHQMSEFLKATSIIYIKSLDEYWILDEGVSSIRRLRLNDSQNPDDWRMEYLAGGLRSGFCRFVSLDKALYDANAANGIYPAGCRKINRVIGYDEESNLVDTFFYYPRDMVYDELENVVYISDTFNHVIRKINVADLSISTIAGHPKILGKTPSGTHAEDTLFNEPSDLALGPNGFGEKNRILYIADQGNDQILAYDLDTSLITKVIGNGERSNVGNGRPASSLSISDIGGMVTDQFGNLFISSNNKVKQVISGKNGMADGSDQVITIYDNDDKNSFPSNATFCLSGLSFRPGYDDKKLYALDQCLGYMVEIEIQN